MNKLVLKSVAALTVATFTGTVVTSVTSAATYDSSANLTLKAGNSVITPVDPTNPTVPLDPINPDGSTPKPGTPGPLSIDYASSLSFGTQSIQATDATYYAHAQTINGSTTTTVPDYVQVTDNRGTFAGWTLSVNTDSQFHLTTIDPAKTSEDSAAAGDYLSGAEISFSGGYTKGTSKATPSSVNAASYAVGTSATTILGAKANEGMGTWVYGLGDNSTYQENGGAPLANADVSSKSPIALKVPGTSVKKAAAYTTNLIWTLSETPAN